MRRILLAAGCSTLAVFAITDAAQSRATAPTKQHVREYIKLYHSARKQFGAKAVGCNLVQKQGSCHIKTNDKDVVKSLAVLHRLLTPVPKFVVPVHSNTSTTVSTTQAGSGSTIPTASVSYYAPSVSTSSGGLANVPGVPSSFAACVAYRESTNGQLSSNVYGIQGPGGTGSISQQKAAFSQMYAARGSEPWAPYDGC